MIYDIYYDESKQDAYWHGFYFVPKENKEYLLNLLHKARQNCNYFSQIHYKKIKGKTKLNHGRAAIVSSWTSIGIAALQQQKYYTSIPKVFLGKTNHRETFYDKIDKLIKCKFAIFKERDNHENMYFKDDNLRNIEITFKMGLKAALHRLFSVKEPITVNKIFIDNDEQYKGEYGRNINKKEICKRLILEKKEYVNFTKDFNIFAQKSNHKKIEKWQDPNDSHLLQLCDVLIGGIRVHSYCPYKNMTRYRISEQCKYLLKHDQNNLARMANSRYLNAFMFNEAWIEDGEWNFGKINVAKNQKHEQLSLKLAQNN